MDIDLLKSCQETINKWDERLVDVRQCVRFVLCFQNPVSFTQLLGMVGFVNFVDTDMAVANIVFTFALSGFTVVLSALQKVCNGACIYAA